MALLALLLLAGCASVPLPSAGDVELTDVPFFPQERYQCGPAALATVLVDSGVDVSPEALVPQVYLPAKRGSLQLEMLAAGRRYDRIPFLFEGGAAAIIAELQAGNPVLVLQNLGIALLPRWHYAVVVGYEGSRGAFILRSGRDERRRMPFNRFVAAWNRADDWGVVMPPPGRLPASPGPAHIAGTIAANEGLVPATTVLQAWRAATQKWPEQADAVFGYANALRGAGDVQGAAREYRAVLRQQPEHLAARNNYADLLLQQGCAAEAERVLAPALEALTADGEGIENNGVAAAVRRTRLEIREAVGAGVSPFAGCSLTR